jgi:hypothetical protein
MIYQNAQGCWRKWLSRRSHMGFISWDKFEGFLKIWKLPEPEIIKMI